MADVLPKPPGSPQAEAALIGALLIDGALVGEVGDIVTAADFVDERHRTIYSAIIELALRSEPIDAVTLSEALERSQTLSRAGGLA